MDDSTSKEGVAASITSGDGRISLAEMQLSNDVVTVDDAKAQQGERCRNESSLCTPLSNKQQSNTTHHVILHGKNHVDRPTISSLSRRHIPDGLVTTIEFKGGPKKEAQHRTIETVHLPQAPSSPPGTTTNIIDTYSKINEMSGNESERMRNVEGKKEKKEGQKSARRAHQQIKEILLTASPPPTAASSSCSSPRGISSVHLSCSSELFAMHNESMRQDATATAAIVNKFADEQSHCSSNQEEVEEKRDAGNSDDGARHQSNSVKNKYEEKEGNTDNLYCKNDGELEDVEEPPDEDAEMGYQQQRHQLRNNLSQHQSRCHHYPPGRQEHYSSPSDNPIQRKLMCTTTRRRSASLSSSHASTTRRVDPATTKASNSSAAQTAAIMHKSKMAEPQNASERDDEERREDTDNYKCTNSDCSTVGVGYDNSASSGNNTTLPRNEGFAALLAGYRASRDGGGSGGSGGACGGMSSIAEMARAWRASTTASASDEENHVQQQIERGRNMGARRRFTERATEPGAVSMPYRAYGIMPNAFMASAARGRNGEEQDEKSDQQDKKGTNHDKNEGLSSKYHHQFSDEEEHLVEATVVSEDLSTPPGKTMGVGESSMETPPLIYVQADVMPSPVKLILRDRSVKVCLLIVTSAVAALIAGALLLAFHHRYAQTHNNIGGGGVASSTDNGGDGASSNPTAEPSSAVSSVALDDLLNVLAPVSGLDTLKQVDSPQHAAMFWLANKDRTVIDYSSEMFLQRYGLLVLYYATAEGEDAWYNSAGGVSGWMNPVKHECDWGGGVTCTVDHYSRRILVSLDLSKSLLNGMIPPEIGLLTNLENLYLNDNNLYGPIPNKIGKLSSLVVLELKKNQLSGSIPDGIGQITDLTSINLSHNRLDGTIAESFYDVTNLRTFDLSYNQISGVVSNNLKQMRVLYYLNLAVNNFSGPLPNSITEMQNLAFVHLDYNKFTGTLPEPLEFLTIIEEFTLSHNQLSGTIPVNATDNFDVKELRLRKLDISHNSISGPISPVITSLSTIEYLDLSSNMLSGPVLPTVEKMRNLEYLKLNNNRLVGSIPKNFPDSLEHLDLQDNHLGHGIPRELANLHSLEYLAVGHNNLGGELPDEIINISFLRYVNIRNCSLTGTIPTTMSNLKQLDILNMGKNHFQGLIPSEIGEMTSLKTLNLDNNLLTGNIPPSLGSLNGLSILSLHDNDLTGSIPEELSKLESIEEIHLKGNNLVGSVPEGVCALRETGLKTLHVDCEVRCNCCIFEPCGNNYPDSEHD